MLSCFTIGYVPIKMFNVVNLVIYFLIIILLDGYS